MINSKSLGHYLQSGGTKIVRQESLLHPTLWPLVAPSWFFFFLTIRSFWRHRERWGQTHRILAVGNPAVDHVEARGIGSDHRLKPAQREKREMRPHTKVPFTEIWVLKMIC